MSAEAAAAPLQVPAVCVAHRQAKQALLDELRSGSAGTRGIRRALAHLAELTDEALRTLWKDNGFDPRSALVAVGGYGRGELFPHSDVDVLLLLPADSQAAHDPALRRRIESFISQCWDTGLEIGSSVRTVDECLTMAAADLTVQTALLEARLVVGNRKLFKAFQQRFMAALDPLDFFVA